MRLRPLLTSSPHHHAKVPAISANASGTAKAIAGAVLGGMTSLPGAVIGGIAIGVIETFGGAYVSSEFMDTFAFFIIIAVLMIRPEGLFGRPAIKKV